MKIKELEAKRDDVIGIVPVYTDTGNATYIFFNTGDMIVDYRGIRAVRANLMRTYAIDYNAQRLHIEKLLNRKGALPFYINNRVFMPLKLRQAVAEGDMVYGFIDVTYLKSIEPTEGGVRCEAFLTTGQHLPIYSSYTSALKCKEIGEKLLLFINESKKGEGEEKEIAKTVVAFIGSLKDISRRLERIEGKIAESDVKWNVKIK